MKLNKIAKMLDGMNVAELRNLNKLVIGYIREKDVECSVAVRVGNTVSFIGRRGIKVEGTVIRKNPKKAVIAVAQERGIMSQRWSVPYSMLTIIKR